MATWLLLHGSTVHTNWRCLYTIVTNTSGLPIIRLVVGQHISSASRPLGSMKTDKDDANALIETCYYSYVSNLFSNHTDCPQMEKFAWLEVTHLLATSTQYIRDVEALYTKILQDILDTQERGSRKRRMPVRDCASEVWACWERYCLNESDSTQ